MLASCRYWCVLTVLWIMLSDELHLTQYIYQHKSTKILPRNWKRFRPQLRDAWEITLKLYLSVNVLSTKVLIGDTLFTSPTRLTGPPFYVVSRATRRSSRFLGRRQYLHFSVTLRPWLLVQPRESYPRPPAQQSNALLTELILRGISEIFTYTCKIRKACLIDAWISELVV